MCGNIDGHRKEEGLFVFIGLSLVAILPFSLSLSLSLPFQLIAVKLLSLRFLSPIKIWVARSFEGRQRTKVALTYIKTSKCRSNVTSSHHYIEKYTLK